MTKFHTKLLFATILIVSLFSGCQQPSPYDYTAFKAHHPKSILILPPVNNSTEIKATPSIYATASLPLAESGYYVFPATLVYETFKENGLTMPNDIHDVSPAKLYKIFNADSALYITINDYGVKYKVIQSDVVVELKAKLVDLKSGETIWSGEARASSAERQSNNNGLLGALISAAINQIVGQITDQGFNYGSIANNRLLSAGYNGGILYGHRSPYYKEHK
ncbi:MAG: DUF799 domain-containing protein [Sulfurovaceae bacterium]|jgi:hypothetical protein|nr:DUF799 domain-containing protein [Sulfurovaceae bacterium]